MTKITPHATAMGARTAQDVDPPRTLAGALVTVTLLVAAVFATSVPAAVLAGLLIAAVTGLGAGFIVGVRSSRRSAGRLFLSWIGIRGRF